MLSNLEKRGVDLDNIDFITICRATQNDLRVCINYSRSTKFINADFSINTASSYICLDDESLLLSDSKNER